MPCTYNRSQATVIRAAAKAGAHLAAAYGEYFLALYRNPTISCQEIADRFAEVIGPLVGGCPQAISATMTAAARQLIPDPKERVRIRLARLSYLASQNSTSFHQAGGIRHQELYPIDAAAMVIARGRVPWSPAELDRAVRLADHPAFWHPTGFCAGMPSYRRITDRLNRDFHGGRPVRSHCAVKEAVRRERKRRFRSELRELIAAIRAARAT